MPGMMRSRVSGCLCLDCSGGWNKDRAQEKREWQAEDWGDRASDKNVELR